MNSSIGINASLTICFTFWEAESDKVLKGTFIDDYSISFTLTRLGMLTHKNQLIADIINVIYGESPINIIPQRYMPEMIRQSLKVDYIRSAVCKNRYDRLKNNLKTFSCPKYSRTLRGNSTIDHNLAGMENDPSGARSCRLIRPLSVIEYGRPLDLLNRNEGALSDIDIQTNQKVLSIGPRNESEILLLWAYGFKLENIVAVDLISYSPFIQVGDMHDLDFDDNTFDVVISSCTLVYSLNVRKAIEEIKRVAKPSAIFAFMSHVDSEDYPNQATLVNGIDITSKNTIAEAFFPRNNSILYSMFAHENLGLPNGTSSSCIFMQSQIRV